MDQAQNADTAVPDLAGIPLEKLQATAGTVLDEALREYRERLAGTAAPCRGFNSSL